MLRDKLSELGILSRPPMASSTQLGLQTTVIISTALLLLTTAITLIHIMALFSLQALHRRAQISREWRWWWGEREESHQKTSKTHKQTTLEDYELANKTSKDRD